MRIDKRTDLYCEKLCRGETKVIKGVLVESIDDMTSTIALGLNQKKNNGKYRSRRKFTIY